MNRLLLIAVTVWFSGGSVIAQTTVQDELARGYAAWTQRLSKSAIEAFEAAAKDPSTSAEAHEALGRIYIFKGWQQEGVLPRWHDEPVYRERAIEELRAALVADPNRTSAKEALRLAQKFAASEKVDPAPARAEIQELDAKIASYRTATDAPIPEIVATVEARARAQADPEPYFRGARLLTDRAEYDRAIALAETGAKVSDRFIDENLGAYQMTGKSQAWYAHGRATALDLVGWALFLKKDYMAAENKLGEAEQLFPEQNFTNQFHLGEVARARNRPQRAREHYVNALSLAEGPPPLREKATQALSSLIPTGVGDFEAWLDNELARRREERRIAALRSMVDRPLPRLPLRSIDGGPFDSSSLQGKVLLLNFFAAW